LGLQATVQKTCQPKKRLKNNEIGNHHKPQKLVVLRFLWCNSQETEVYDAMNKKAEPSRLEIEHQLILDAAGEGIYGLNREGRITFGNAAAFDIVGWHTDDVLGQRAHDVHHHSHSDGSPYPRDECPIYAALKDGEVHNVDSEVFWHANGAAVPVEYTSTPIIKDGKPDGAVVVFRDISQRREIERQR